MCVDSNAAEVAVFHLANRDLSLHRTIIIVEVPGNIIYRKEQITLRCCSEASALSNLKCLSITNTPY